MTPYTLSYYHNIKGQWVRTIHEFKAADLAEAREEFYDILTGGMYPHCASLEVGLPAQPYVPRHVKNTNAWKPRKYG